MGLIFKPPRVSQPTAPTAVDRSNPLARGLVFAAYPIGGKYYDAISRLASYAEDTAVQAVRVGRTIDGNQSAALFTGSVASRHRWDNGVTGLDRLNGAFSIFAEAGVVDAVTGTALSSAEAGNGFGVIFHITDDINIVSNGFYCTTDNSPRTISNVDALGASSHSFFHRFMITGDGGTEMNCYAKNKLNRTETLAHPITLHSSRATRIHGSYNGASANSSCSVCLAWNRPLSLLEFQALYGNPWQLFAPLPRQMWAPAEYVPPPVGTLGQFDPELRIAGWF